MATFSLAEIMGATGANLIGGPQEGRIESICTDSRQVQPKSLFIPLHGEKFDGHDFISGAVQKGTVAVLTEKEITCEPQVSVLLVKNTLVALQMLARYHRRRCECRVVAVTGSNGKTTTKDLIATVLSQKFNVCKTNKNYNNEIGLPLTLLQIEKEHEVCVVEMGMRGLGQIAELARIAEPDVGVVTNVGVSHIELLGTKENIAKAKSELVASLSDKGTAVLNSDDALVAAMAKQAKGRVIEYGMGNQAMVQALDVVYEKGKTRFTCRSFDEVFPVTMSLLGEHNVYNALAAIAVARLEGVPTNKIQRGLAQAEMGSMRQEVVDVDGIRFVNDTYNANPVSVQAALHTLQQFGNGRKVLVLGDMLELGEKAKEFHRDLATVVHDVGVELVVTVGDLAAELARSVKREGFADTVACASIATAVESLKNLLREGDVVLVKGSRSMGMERIVEAWGRGRN